MGDLSARQKAAVALLSVDSATAASVLKNMDEADLAALTREMHALGDVEPQAAGAVLHEFTTRAMAERGIEASPEALRERLDLAVGEEGANRLFAEMGVDDAAERVFHPLAQLPPEQLHKVLCDEHPQTAALALGHLDTKLAAATLALFAPEAKVDVVRRMARSQPADEAMMRRVGELIRNKTGMFGQTRKTPEDPRYKKVAEVINLLGAQSEEEIMKSLADDSPEMAKKLREMMFVFEDIVSLSDTDLRKVLMSIDTQILAMALKTASEPLKEKVFRNLSRRATETLTEELEMLGLKPLSQVKTAQRQIVEVIRKMDGGGEISIRGAKFEEDPLV